MTFALQTHSANRASLIWGLGQLESEKTISLAQLVIHDEVVAFARHYQRGFAVTCETLAYDVIRDVGIAGSYLETEHTLENFRRHLWSPKILNRRTRVRCAGPLEEIARRRAAEIITQDTSAKIGAAELSELKRIEAAYRRAT